MRHFPPSGAPPQTLDLPTIDEQSFPRNRTGYSFLGCRREGRAPFSFHEFLSLFFLGDRVRSPPSRGRCCVRSPPPTHEDAVLLFPPLPQSRSSSFFCDRGKAPPFSATVLSPAATPLEGNLFNWIFLHATNPFL